MIQTTTIDNPELRCGPLVIDLNGFAVRLGDQPVFLTYKEFNLLVYLASRPNHAVSRRQLLQDVWGRRDEQGARTVDVHIRRLRSKLERGGRHWIATVHNVGYKFVAPEGSGH